MRSFVTTLLLLAALVLTPGSETSDAASIALTVTPSRIILDQQQRSQDVLVINNSEVPIDYVVEIQHIEQDSTGYLREATVRTLRQDLAEQMLRFSPRQGTVPPTGQQTVRILSRPMNNIPAGEYRAHVHFKPIPPADPIRPQGGSAPAEGMGMQINFYVGISIPVMVRVGEPPLSVGIESLSFGVDKQQRTVGEVMLSRQGERSTTGTVDLLFTPADGGEPISIGRHSGVTVYVPNDKRSIGVPLDLPEGWSLRDLKGGRITVRFYDDEADSGALLAEQAFNL